MLTGHFGVSYALKAKEKHASLGLLFLAVGFADLIWSLFIHFGVEKAQIVPTLPSSRLNLYYMPFDHSLVGILFWSIVIYVLFRFLPAGQGARKSMIALVMALAVFSHFVLDIPVHRADLALFDNAYKIGLGLYNYLAPPFWESMAWSSSMSFSCSSMHTRTGDQILKTSRKSPFFSRSCI